MAQGIGLLMEGGALRGLFTAGVLDLLMELELPIACAVGVSAGAAFGCNLKSRQPGRVLRYNLRFCRDPRYWSWQSLAKTGDLFGADFCYRAIPLELDPFDTQAYNQNPMEFHVVCTDVDSGKPVYQDCSQYGPDTMDWFRASASMPFLSHPVEIGGRRFLDGGIADPIPIQWLESRGFETNIVILTQPRSYVKKPMTGGKLLEAALKGYPALREPMEGRHLRYAESRARVFTLERAGKALVICPEEALPVSRLTHDPAKLQGAWALGRAAGEKALPALRELIRRIQQEEART